jgi:uncharacterized membrane protein YtjA (UPF0391 family)
MIATGTYAGRQQEPFRTANVLCPEAVSNPRPVEFDSDWAVTFLIVALIAGVLGFGGVAIVSVEIAKTIFVIAIVLFLVAAIFGFMRGRSPGAP